MISPRSSWRRWLPLVMVCALGGAFAPNQLVIAAPADPQLHGLTNVVFHTLIACGPTCPDSRDIIFDTGNGASTPARCRRVPLTVPYSYDEVWVPVPDTLDGGTPTSISFTIFPSIDYDASACLILNKDTSSEAYTTVPHPILACYSFCAGPCREQLPVFLGCPERIEFEVQPGETYALRVFNVADGQTVPGVYGFTIDSPS